MPKIYGYTEVFGDIVIMGSFSITGSASTINTTNLLVEDPILVLAHGQTGSPALDSGFFIDRGAGATQAFIWDESTDQFALISTTDSHTTIGNVNISGYSDLRLGNIGIGGAPSADITAYIKGADSGSTNHSLKIEDVSSNALLYVRNDGVVGIGTASPGAVLAIEDTLTPDSLRKVLLVKDSLDTEILSTSRNTLSTSTINQRHNALGGNLDVQYTFATGDMSWYSTNYSQDTLRLNVNTSPIFSSPFQNAIRFDSLVGIGMTGSLPTSSLHIKGATSTSASYALKVDSSDSSDGNMFNIRNDGKIGIGVTSPTQRLHLVGGSTTGGVLFNLNDVMFDVPLSGSTGQLRFSYGANIEFMMNPYPNSFSTSFRFKSNPAGTSGESGIEHTTIGQLNGAGFVIGESLNVGSSGTNSGTIWGKVIRKSGFTNPNAIFYPLLALDGNVGIGLSTPTAKLEVRTNTSEDGVKVSIPTGDYIMSEIVYHSASGGLYRGYDLSGNHFI